LDFRGIAELREFFEDAGADCVIRGASRGMRSAIAKKPLQNRAGAAGGKFRIRGADGLRRRRFRTEERKQKNAEKSDRTKQYSAYSRLALWAQATLQSAPC
jgi:hypothetical protein